jgi:hypothetical protein
MGTEQAIVTAENNIERIKELMKRKKVLLTRIRKSRKLQIRARMEKRKINEELRRLKGKKNLFNGMTKEQAMDKVRRDIDGVRPEHIYMKPLERAFDKIERPGNTSKNYSVIDLGKLSENPRSLPKVKPDSGDDDVIVEQVLPDDPQEDVEQEEVIDMSDQ